MNYVEKEWVKASTAVSEILERIDHKKRKQLIYRINKKAYEMALRNRKTLMNNAMRAGNYSEVSRHHKVINILRKQLKQESGAINGTKSAIKWAIKTLEVAESRRDQFAEACRLMNKG